MFSANYETEKDKTFHMDFRKKGMISSTTDNKNHLSINYIHLFIYYFLLIKLLCISNNFLGENFKFFTTRKFSFSSSFFWKN